MSGPASFATLFVSACHAKNYATASDIAVKDGNGLPGEPLITCGSGEQALTFSDTGLWFKGPNGAAVEYTWLDLDFILPSDLTLVSSMVYTFTDMDLLAERIALVTGRAFAVAAVAGLAFLIIATVYSSIAPIVGTLHAYLGIVGDALSLLGFFMLVMVLSPVIIPIALGAMATGGAVAMLGNAVGKQVRPLARWGLSLIFRDFPNGVQIIKSRWVKPPWGTPTTSLRDMILLGVKLQRRGFT
ncbi:MAG: hypothetical protein GC184_13695 [Rhizobiales bacterium]|nr:hypothetical protein [Hyphomicrobiales bacterium]